MSENLPFNEALGALEVFSQEIFASDLYVPSLERFIKLKEITAKQQKKIISSVIDSTSGKYKPYFTAVFYQILKENCSEPLEVINNLSSIDRQFLTVGLKNLITNKIKIETENNNFEEVSLDSVLEKIKNFKHPQETVKLIEKNSLSIELKLKTPSLKLEMCYFDEMPFLKKESSDTETVKKVLTEAYIYETSKHISGLTIQDKNLNFENLSVLQKYSVVEKLPAYILQIILAQVAEWKSAVDEVLTIVTSTGEEKVIEADGSLFVTS